MKKKKLGKARGVYLPDDIMEWLKSAAEKEKRSVSNFLQILLEEKRQEARSIKTK